MTDDKDALWDEIKETAATSARIKAHRDAAWYLRALAMVREAETRLYEGLANTVQAWMMANGLDEEE
jgi:hypothetical protein